MHINDVNDVLGPLPQIPTNESHNWSRRISEIYEEIPDTSLLNTRNSRRVSGVSVASGIYEEMRPVLNEEEGEEQNQSILSDGEKCETPPALPPRLRVNTLEIHRSYTNPETETFKKKTRTVFSSMFGRSKRSTSCSEPPQTPVKNCTVKSESVVKDVEVVPKRRIKSRFLGFDLLENKRNSFSSPDLTKFNQYSNDYFDAVDIGSCSSEFEIFGSTSSSSNNNSNDFLNIDFNFTTDGPKEEELNISERIHSNFNISCNTSTVNLVGSNCNDEEISSNRKNLVFVDDLSGYCIMKPIVPKKDPDGLRLVTLERGLEKEFKFEDLFKGDKNDVVLYENIKNLKIIDNKPNDNLLKEDEEEEFYKSPKSTTFDDKVPSYFPNNCSTKKPPKIIVKNLTNLTVSNSENFYTPSPLKKNDSIRRKYNKKSPEVYIEEVKPDEEVKQQTTPRLYQKYATLARLSPTRYSSQEKSQKTKTVDGSGSVKRFASLPRFKKIDFSPLKIKINAVLQRHNSEF